MDSDTQAQAEDRRAQVEALMDRTLSVFKEEDNELEEAVEGLLDELSRLSRVEQALRALVVKWDESAEWESENGNMLSGQTLDQCADELRAVLSGRLSASPEAQPEEGR